MISSSYEEVAAMVPNVLFGRDYEKRKLTRCLEMEQAQLILVYGRRRVGKTYLIHQFFNGRFDFKLTGIYNRPKSVQLENFSYELNRQSGKNDPVPKDWLQAFQMLRDYLSTLPEDEKSVVFLDEMPWMDSTRSDLLTSFEWFWNGWGNMRSNLIVIVCGSATSWLSENIEENKGGLFSRLSCKLYLQPFNLHETEQFLKSRGIEWSRYDITECYMIMGGIPYYLSMLDPQMSFAQNIDNLFFRKRAELWDEFDHLYHTLFKNSEQYIAVAEVLSQKQGGLTREEIIKKTSTSGNGHLSKILKDLLDCGFVRTVPFFGKEKQNARYQLADYYSRFYFRFVKNRHGRDEHFWSHALDLPSRHVWAGLTFEQVCLDHLSQIRHRLGISGVLSEVSTWSSPGSKEGSGAQIDFVIDRRDHVINLCEVKYSINLFEIDRSYDLVLRNKMDLFRNEAGTKKALQMTMITTYGLRNSKYNSLIGRQVVLDDLFQPDDDTCL